VLAELGRQNWASKHLIDVVVRNGVVELWGTVLAWEERTAARVAAETVPGVKGVRSHIAMVEPMSGMVFLDPEDETNDANCATTAAPTTAPSPVSRSSRDTQ